MIFDTILPVALDRNMPLGGRSNWSPLSDIEKVFDAIAPWNKEAIRSANGLSKGFSPSVNVEELEDCFLVSAELPGLEREDISVTLENGMLSISGEKKTELAEGAEGKRYVERSYGSFSRRFELPSNIDEKKIEASMKNGVLSLVLAKTEPASLKKITIKV